MESWKLNYLNQLGNDLLLYTLRNSILDML